MKKVCIFLILFFISPFAFSKESPRKEACFSCHSNYEKFESSSHGMFDCSICHTDLDIDRHFVKKSLKKEEGRRKLYLSCLKCHDKQLLIEKANHKGVIEAGFLCSQCHDPHGEGPIKVKRERLNEKAYCLSCHGKKGLEKRFKNGERIALFVDESLFLSSTHGKNDCSYCHREFSKKSHPKRSYETKRAFSLELAPKACERCHIGECKRFERCVHGALLKKGEGLAPTCADCHNPHYTKIEKNDENLHFIKCKDCHKDISESYKRSVHYKAWKEGKRNAPLCTGCHKPHEVLVTSFNLKNNETCLECHKEAERAHLNWFYNPPYPLSSFVRFHLDSVNCNVCHAPQAKGAIYLHLHDKTKRTPFHIEELISLFDLKERGDLKKLLDENRNGMIEVPELWSLFNSLLGKGKTLTLLGWMDVRDPRISHETKPKEEALKGCELCHRHDSPFFEDAFIIVRDKYGWPMVFKASKEVLSTKSALSPLSEFYVFGSTRLKITDFLLILAVLGAILVPVGHIILRLLTRSLRKKR